MSRIGKLPVEIPTGVEAKLVGRIVTLKGSNGELSVAILAGSNAELKDGKIWVTPVDLKKNSRMAWGTTRQLINNAVIGVSKGFSKRLEINGVGLKMAVQGDNLKLNLGFSHEVNFPIEADVKMKIEGDKNNILVISGASKQRVGQIASNIRSMKKPEPYKGKGIKYSTETVLRKEGKKK
jgi:large subunit ribosomal protein L6